MKISPKGVLETAEHEGIALARYKDSVGVDTYGIGHTKAAGGPNPEAMPFEDTRGWSEDKVRRTIVQSILPLFDVDLDKYEARVNEAIAVPLKQHQFDALVSFDFNTGGIYRAKLTEAINSGDMSGDGFMGWLKPPEIIKRRKAEQELFRTGRYDANGDAITIWDTYGEGRLKWRGTISGAELAALMAEGQTKRRPPSLSLWARLWAALGR